jgi:hypothetical protein
MVVESAIFLPNSLYKFGPMSRDVCFYVDHWLRMRKFCVFLVTLMRMQSAYEIGQTLKQEKLIRVGRVLRLA